MNKWKDFYNSNIYIHFILGVPPTVLWGSGSFVTSPLPTLPTALLGLRGSGLSPEGPLCGTAIPHAKEKKHQLPIYFQHTCDVKHFRVSVLQNNFSTPVN